MIILETNMGNICINIDEDKAPITAKNFIDYVEDSFFDGTIFHRVIKNFMIQGGGFTEDMSQKPTKAEIENEADNGLKNVKYSIAMARTMAPHSASSQFFINTADNGFLDYPGQDGWVIVYLVKLLMVKTWLIKLDLLILAIVQGMLTFQMIM